MKALALLSLSLAVALGRPPFDSRVAPNPVLTGDNQSPLLGDWVPVQGHVVVEDPAPQVRPRFEEQQVKPAPVNLNPEVKAEVKVDVKPDVEMEPELSDNPDFKVEPDVQEAESEESHIDMEEKYELLGEPIMQQEPRDEDNVSEANQSQDPVNQRLSEEEEKTYVLDGEPIMELENQQVEDVPELSDNPDFKVESEVQVEPDVQEAESEERHIDMEDKSEMAGNQIMEMEPLDDDDMSEEERSHTEKSLRAAFQHQGPVNQYVSEEGGLMRERTYVLDGEPIMELENQQVVDVPELSDNPDFKVESEVQETEAKLRDIDMEKRYEIVGEPIMELEPLDDDYISKEELSEMELLEVDTYLRTAYQNQNPVNQRLSEEEEGLIEENTYVLDGEPIFELEPLEVKVQENFEEEGEEGRENDIERKYEIVGGPIMELEPLEDDNEAQKEFPVQMNLEEETTSNQNTEEKHIDMEARYEMVGEPIMELEPLENKETEQTEEEGGPALDIFGQPMKTSEEYFPNKEARMGSPMVDGSDYLMMDETASEFVQTDQMSPMAADSPVINYVREPRTLRRQAVNNPEERRSSSKHNKQGKVWPEGQNCSAGVMIEEKCYQFFGGKNAADAEFFCQDHFSGGHLASITSPYVHREVMNLIRQWGSPRTWVGGLRFLETGRFIWLDGSHWGYDDWKFGEPNNSGDLEHCVELLANGKFNDFTCWEGQAFVCSF